MRHTVVFAWRNLWRNKRRTLITISSIAFAVIIASFMRGTQLGSYEKMLNDAIRSTTGHLAIMNVDYWDNKNLINSFEHGPFLDSLLFSEDHAAIVAPEISTGVLASSGRNTRGVAVMGVDPAIEARRTGLKGQVVEGRYLDAESSGILIGEQLAQFLQIELGDSVVLLGQGYMGVTAAAALPVEGIFDHPMDDIEKRIVYMNLSLAEDVFYMHGRRTRIGVVLDDYTNLDETEAHFISSVDTSEFDIRNWKSMNKVLLQQIESDDFFGRIIIGILYLVIGFGIFGTVLMMVMERRREFSVMMALGMRSGALVRIVLLETLIMGSIGAIIGLALSFPVIWYFHLNPIPITGESAELYLEFNIEPVLEVALRPISLVWQFVIVFVLSLAAGFFPVTSIPRFDFVSIIRGRR